jgi:hypothetical protein
MDDAAPAPNLKGLYERRYEAKPYFVSHVKLCSSSSQNFVQAYFPKCTVCTKSKSRKGFSKSTRCIDQATFEVFQEVILILFCKSKARAYGAHANCFIFSLREQQCLSHVNTCGNIFPGASPLHQAEDAMSSNCSGGSTDEVISLVGDVGDITKRPLESGIGGGMAAAATLTSDGNLGLFGNAAADDMKKRPYSGDGSSDSSGASSDGRAQKKMTTTSVLGEKSGLECSPDDLLLLCTELEERCAHSEQQLAKMEQEKHEELAKAAERQREELAEAAEVRRVLAELRTFKKNAASKLAARRHGRMATS